MKTIRTIRIIILLMVVGLTANTVMGSGKVKVDLISGLTDLAVVEIVNSEMSEIEVDLKDSYGETLYSKKTKTPLENFKTKYDFSSLEDGTYRFTVKIDKEKTVNTFKIVNGGIKEVGTRKSVDPYFKFEHNILKVTFLNFEKENTKMYAYDGNTLLYEKELGSEFSIDHGVNFSDLGWGDYRVVLANDLDIYEYEVSIR